MTRHRRSGDPNINKLIVNTNCGPDNDFISLREARWCAALGKLLVANSTTANFHIRNADLSFASKYTYSVNAGVSIDADNANIYTSMNTANAFRKWDLLFSSSVASSILGNGSLRMIDASGDPLHVYVTSNSVANGHGIRMVTKSTMAVTSVGGNEVKILATGTGDNQFTNPLGVLYIATNADSGFLYVCEATRICKIAVVTTAGSESFTWTTSYAIAANDLAWDGTNFYVQSSTQTIKYDNVFTDATKVATACVGYSITYIPDQGDGNGATLAISNNSGNCLYRRKCSDLSLIATVGSAGDGSASLFDPVITYSGTGGYWLMDDGSTFPVASGANISWNGFSGYTFRNTGPHKAVFRGVPLAQITEIDCNTDLVTKIGMRNLGKCTKITAYTNAGLVARLTDLPPGLTTASFYGDPLLTGDIANLPAGLTTAYFNSDPLLTGDIANLPAGLTYVQFSSDPLLTGDIANLPAGLTYVHFSSDPLLTGDIANLPAGLTIASFYGDPLLTSGSIDHLVIIRDIRIYSMGWTAQQNTDVLLSAWNARASYTYASGIALRISAPTGTPGTEPPAEEGPGHDTADWAWNAGTSRYDPLTGYAVISDLQNDFYSEGFKGWSITIV